MKEKSNQTKREIYSQNQQAHSQFKGGGGQQVLCVKTRVI